MIIREGFVSNSSTTSFTCDACGDVIAYNDNYGTTEMNKFSCGHEICNCINKYLFSNKKKKQKWIKENKKIVKEYIEILKSFDDECNSESIEKLQNLLQIKDFGEFYDELKSIQEEEYDLEYSENLCPVCSLEKLNNNHIMKYFLVKHKGNLQEILKEIQEEFTSFDDLQNWIKENEK